MKMTKELWDILAGAYVQTYKTDVAFYELGTKTGVWLSFDGDPQTKAIEDTIEILTEDEMVIENLCTFASEGSVEITSPDGERKVCFTLDDIWESIEEWENE